MTATTFGSQLAASIAGQTRQVEIGKQIDSMNTAWQKAGWKSPAEAGKAGLYMLVIRIEQIASVVISGLYLVKHVGSGIIKGADNLTRGDFSGLWSDVKDSSYKAFVDLVTAFYALGAAIAPSQIRDRIAPVNP